jgi:uncharacterized phiE125 gp8 family phage protein
MPVNRTITLVSVPDAAQVVTLEKAKAHLRVMDDDSDEQIVGEVEAAISWAEDFTARPIRRAQYLLSTDGFQMIDRRWSVRIQGSVSSIDSIQYRDSSGNLQTVDSSVYQTLIGQHSTLIREAPNKSWPELNEYLDALRVTFTAGWTDTDVPLAVRQAILLMVGKFHFTRAPGDPDEANTAIGRGVEIAAKNLLGPWKLPVW